MKIQEKKNKGILIGVIIFIILVALGIAGAVFYFNSDMVKVKTNQPEQQDEKSDSDKSDKSSDQDEDSDNAEQKTETTNNDNDSVEEGKTGNQDAPAQEAVNSSPTLTGVINYKSVVNNTLQIRTTINQYLSEGTCALTLNGPNGQVYSTNVNIIANPSSSTCAGFDIPLDLIQTDQDKRRGEWTINIHLTSGTRAGDLQDKISL